MRNVDLSFKLRIARTPADLLAACSVRSEAYGRHLPSWQPVLSMPDKLDVAKDSVVLLCVDKATGQAVGTARIQVNSHRPLVIERSVELPAHLGSESRAEVTRLAVLQGTDPLIKHALMKGAYLYCIASQIRRLVIGARSEPLIRMYERMGFVDLFAPDVMVPLAHAGNEPHRILSFNVTTAEERWRNSGHRLYDFVIETFHPDISLFTTEPALDLEQASRFAELQAA